MADDTQFMIDWTRVDVQAIVTGGGIAFIDDMSSPTVVWCKKEGYYIWHLRLEEGFPSVLGQIGSEFGWIEQFGYRLEDGRGVLDAIRDGFQFEDKEKVVMIVTGHSSFTEIDWLKGLLDIATEHSREMSYLGKRFFVLLVGPPLVTHSPGIYVRL